MKVIDLLNKIAKGEKVPEKIKFDDEVEIIEEKPKHIEELDRSKPFSTFDVADKVDELTKAVNYLLYKEK